MHKDIERKQHYKTEHPWNLKKTNRSYRTAVTVLLLDSNHFKIS